MVVDPVEPTYARTFSRLETVIAVMNDRMIRTVEIMANLRSESSRVCGPLCGFGVLLISELRDGLPSGGVRRRGRQFRHASMLARHGWICSG